MRGSQQYQVQPDQALEEVSQRLLASMDLASYGEYIYPDWYKAYAMHRLMCVYLEQVLAFLETGTGIQNLMILTSPQHGKSVTVSNVFTSFGLGKLPNLRILMGSYGADLATDNSRETRSIVLSDEYQAIFGARSAMNEPVMLSSDSRAVSRWDLASPYRGGMIATGRGGAFTGRAKGLVILDDLFKDHRDAESKEVRDDVWDWVRSSVLPRAKAIVLVMTHWNPDDVAGRFMRQMVMNPKAHQWTILMLPGMALEPGEYAQSVDEQRKRMLEGVYLPLKKDPLDRAPGEVLCPAMMSKEEMEKVKNTSEDYFFLALYQQMPFSKEGQRYKRAWFKIIDHLPEKVTLKFKVRYWDKASSPTGDYTAGPLEAYGSDGNFYFLDAVRGQWSSYERDQAMLKAAKSDRQQWGDVKIWHQQDPGSAGLDSAQATNRLLMGFPAKFEPVSGSKETRSENLESSMQGGQVFLLKGHWNEAFIEELCAFPQGRYDDQVDGASSAHNKLLEMIGQHRESKIL